MEAVFDGEGLNGKGRGSLDKRERGKASFMNPRAPDASLHKKSQDIPVKGIPADSPVEQTLRSTEIPVKCHAVHVLGSLLVPHHFLRPCYNY